MFTVKNYSPEHKNEWDDFCREAKNATFLFERGYMDYHADRFCDASKLIYNDGKLYGIIPLSAHGDTAISHGGLTYGGLAISRKGTTAPSLEGFGKLLQTLHDEGFKSLLYKPLPHIYHSCPAEEDLYAIFRCGGELKARNVSAVIDLESPLPFQKLRNRGVKKALKTGIVTKQEDTPDNFWPILEANLAAVHHATPVHSLNEMRLLMSRFPGNIKVHTAWIDNEIAGGTVLYIDRKTVHTQYISASHKGKAAGALDLLFHHLITEVYAKMKWFDFGTSNLDGGKVLNESLIFQKEGFGARAVCYDTYLIPTNQAHRQ